MGWQPFLGLSEMSRLKQLVNGVSDSNAYACMVVWDVGIHALSKPDALKQPPPSS